MVGELRDAHTRVRSPRQRQERKNLQATSAGVRLYEVEGTPVVFSVTPDSEAARSGVMAGMVVRTVNDQPIAEAVSNARREIGTSSSERATRLLSYSRIIAGEPDTPLKLGLTRADGTAFDVTLTLRTVSAAPQFEERILPSGYAYIKFNRFLPPVGKQIREALIKFKDAPALILDLRSNGGGDGELGGQIAGYFFNDKTAFATLITRTGKPPSALLGLIKIPKNFKAGKKGGQLYSKPVVILINEATGSTSELFASALQEHNRAAVIGTQSCGCVLGVLNYKQLKGGGDLSISEIGFVTSKGRTLEGNGVTPDKPIAVTVADIQRQRDAALEEAEIYLGGLKRNE
jgi:carboxyl-terminal processing protease